MTAGGLAPDPDPAGVDAQHIRVRAKVADGGLPRRSTGLDCASRRMNGNQWWYSTSLLRNDLKRDASNPSPSERNSNDHA